MFRNERQVFEYGQLEQLLIEVIIRFFSYFRR